MFLCLYGRAIQTKYALCEGLYSVLSVVPYRILFYYNSHSLPLPLKTGTKQNVISGSCIKTISGLKFIGLRTLSSEQSLDLTYIFSNVKVGFQLPVDWLVILWITSVHTLSVHVVVFCLLCSGELKCLSPGMGGKGLHPPPLPHHAETRRWLRCRPKFTLGWLNLAPVWMGCYCPSSADIGLRPNGPAGARVSAREPRRALSTFLSLHFPFASLAECRAFPATQRPICPQRQK